MAIAICSQAQTMGTVKGSQSLQEGPGTEFASFGMLPADCSVQVLEEKDGWTKVGFDSLDEDGKEAMLIGYIPTDYITVDASSVAKDYSKLTRVQAPAKSCECSVLGAESITPKSEKKSTCSLRINAKDATYDAVVKLCNVATDECVRMVYMKRGTAFMIANIPYGEYCVKTISGEDLCNLTAEDNGWNIAFAKEGVSSKSQQTFNFQKDKNSLHWSTTRSWEFAIEKR